MVDTPRYPFSDLTLEDLERLAQAAHQERSGTIRRFLRRLFRRRRRAPKWLQRQREAQAWPSASERALSPRIYI